MASRYIITLSNQNSLKLEKWLSGGLIIGPADRPLYADISRIEQLDLTGEAYG